MTVKTAALGCVDGNAWSKRDAAIIAPRAIGRYAGLRAVVHGMRISRSGQLSGQWICKRPATNGLMVGAARRSATFIGNPVLAIIIGDRRHAATLRQGAETVSRRGGYQLRDNGATCLAVREQDRIHRDQIGPEKTLVFPGCPSGNRRIVKGGAERLFERDEHHAAGFPVDANRRLTRSVAQIPGGCEVVIVDVGI